MSLLVAISDLHLDAVTSGVERFPEVSHTLREAAAYAIQHNASAFLFLGDLCDPNTVRSHRAVAELAAVMADLKRNLVQPVVLAGNHDVVEDGSGTSVLDVLQHVAGCLVFTRPEWHLLRSLREVAFPVCRLIALPYTPSSESYEPAAMVAAFEHSWNHGPVNYPEVPTLVIGHLNLEGITVGSETTEMPRGRDVFWPLEALALHMPDAFLLGGHYHTPQVYQGVHIVGSAARLRFDERDNDPGFLTLEI